MRPLEESVNISREARFLIKELEGHNINIVLGHFYNEMIGNTVGAALIVKVCSRLFSLAGFVFPIQIMRRYSGEYFLSKLDIFMLACSLFNEHDKSSNLLGIVT